MTHARLSCLALAFALAASACNNTTAPTAPVDSVAEVVESFSGTLTVNGAVTHPFVVSTPSAVTATLVSVGAGPATAIGMALGTWASVTETCQLIVTNDNALQGRFIVGTAQTSGTFCVRVADVGKLVEATTYQVTVSHR